ncbi:MAG TPA: PDZ domain-containing protein [Candidatus Acidoferrum sp.]|nr:PDZ domain-containing protein [Candidatus Acidoferrum sp.]
MRRCEIPALLAVLYFSLFSSTSWGAIRYEVSLAHPENHLFHVTMHIPDVSGTVTVQLPAWNALYQIRDFSSHMQEVEALVGAQRVPIEKLDKLTWRITATGTVRIQYATYWDEPGPFASQLNSEHAFLNPAMLLMYVVGRQQEKVNLAIMDFPREWRAEGALLEECKLVFDQPSCPASAAGYDALVDAPVEAGKFEDFDLPDVSPRITVVIHGDNWRKKQVEQDLTRICQYQIKLMDGAPFKRYTFIFHIGKAAAGAGGSGMEHAYSTAISVPSDEYLPGVAAHEFFHLWNVKRVRPASLEPVDYTKEQHTRALWFAEGVTSTYGSYTLVRTGIWSRQRFYEDLGGQITELEARPANRWQSAEQSSLDAWLEKYSLYNQPERSVSYYTKGQVLGILLDLLIRDRTNDEKSLDDVLRALNSDFAKEGTFYRDSLDIRLTAEKIAGGSFEEFFQQYVSGTDPLPYEHVLTLAGLQLGKTQRKRAALGFDTGRDANLGLVVRGVEAGGVAEQAGLRAGDVIVKWNGGEASRRLERWVREQNAGSLLRLLVRREEKEFALEIHLGEVTETYYQVEEKGHAGEKARRIREGLLHGETQPAFSR